MRLTMKERKVWPERSTALVPAFNFIKAWFNKLDFWPVLKYN